MHRVGRLLRGGGAGRHGPALRWPHPSKHRSLQNRAPTASACHSDSFLLVARQGSLVQPKVCAAWTGVAAAAGPRAAGAQPLSGCCACLTFLACVGTFATLKLIQLVKHTALPVVEAGMRVQNCNKPRMGGRGM